MKKKIVALSAVMVVIVAVIIIAYTIIFMPRTISSKFIKGKDITEIHLMSGSTGEIVSLSEEQKSEIMAQLEKIKVGRSLKKSDSSGWNYRLQLMYEDGMIDIVLNKEYCTIDKKEYKNSNEDVIMELISYCKTIMD